MKLTVATALAVALCLGSLAARSSILHRAAAARAQEPVPTASAVSERTVLASIDDRLHSKLRRLALR